jgi:F420-non-reducing hydrogenase large subunit
MKELLEDSEITNPDIRTEPTETPSEGVGIVEAPRGTLIHHYCTDDNGILTKVNLIVATNFNSAPMAMSVEKAAKGMIKGGVVNDGLLNMVEMAFRAYDPCLSCATHSLPGQMPLVAKIHDSSGKVIREIQR